jgi:hypothetical protein
VPWSNLISGDWNDHRLRSLAPSSPTMIISGQLNSTHQSIN